MSDRNYVWLLRYMKGENMVSIAQSAGVTRKRVAQVLNRLGAAGFVSRNWMWRCPGAQQALEAMKPPYEARKAFSTQRSSARRRGVKFCLTLDQWWGIWMASGKWAERGIRKHQFCMSRTYDAGPYEVGNVRICTNAENRKEYLEVIARVREVMRTEAAQRT